MAKASTLSKVAREKANLDRKAKADKIQQQKASKLAEVAGNLSDGKSNVLTIHQGNMPLLHLDIDPATAQAPAANQKYLPNEAVLEHVAKLAAAESLVVELSSLARKAKDLTWEVACLCVVIAHKLVKNGHDSMPLLGEFIKALEPIGAGNNLIRVNAVRAWLLKYAPLEWGVPVGAKSDKKDFVFSQTKYREQKAVLNKSEKKFHTDRLATPFWKVQMEGEFQKFDFPMKLKTFATQLNTILEMSEADREKKFGKDGLNLQGAEEFQKMLNRFYKKEPELIEGKAEPAKEIKSEAEAA